MKEVELRLGKVGAAGHVWRRKELESYVLVPTAIARRSKADADAVAAELDRLAAEKKEEVFAQIVAERLQREVSADRPMTQVMKDARVDFERAWANSSSRTFMCNAKDLLSGINKSLQSGDHRTVSSRTLSSGLRTDEIADEMVDVRAITECCG